MSHFIINLIVEYIQLFFPFPSNCEWSGSEHGSESICGAGCQVHWVCVKEWYSWVIWEIYFYLFESSIQDFQSGWTTNSEWEFPFPHIFSGTCSFVALFFSVWGKMKSWCCFDLISLIAKENEKFLRYFLTVFLCLYLRTLFRSGTQFFDGLFFWALTDSGYYSFVRCINGKEFSVPVGFLFNQLTISLAIWKLFSFLMSGFSIVGFYS